MAVVVVSGRYLGAGASSSAPSIPNPVFGVIRRVTLGVLTIASVLLAFAGVLAIWEVITDKEVLYKSIGSLAILALGAFVMVIACMDRENNPLLHKQGVSFGGAIATLILLYLIFSFSGFFS